MKIYLCGAIEKEKDGGRGIRSKIKKHFSNTSVEFIDPCEFEFNKNYKSATEIRRAYPCTWKPIIKGMINGDLNGVKESGVVLAILNKNAYIGSYSEIIFAGYNNIPVILYFIDDTKYEDMHCWVQASSSHVVYSLKDLSKVIEEYYKIKT